MNNSLKRMNIFTIIAIIVPIASAFPLTCSKHLISKASDLKIQLKDIRKHTDKFDDPESNRRCIFTVSKLKNNVI